MESKYVLAMYDIRGKQEYIFRKNQIKEIVGGSCIIRDCFQDYLYPAAKEYRDQCKEKKEDGEAIYQYNSSDGKVDQFSTEKFKSRMDNDTYLGEVVYEGGGNFFILYKNKDVCEGINKIFTKRLMEKTGSLKVLCTWIEVNENLDDYVFDRDKLYRKHKMNEAQESVIRPVNTLPFVQVDRTTSLPLTNIILGVNGRKEKVSTESYAKYQKYYKVAKEKADVYGEKVLDRLVKKKGEDSLLAVIFIDGNNMGAQVRACLMEDDKSYDKAIKALREFSVKIQKDYIENRMNAIDQMLAEKYSNEQEENSNDKRRFVVYAGDEMSIICRAEDALDIVKAYFKEMPKSCSSCVGIAVFHSHAPYAEAYRIAEECCENGKKKMKEANPPETTTCYVDYHYCKGGLGMELEDIREREVGEIISKPWLIRSNEEKLGIKPEHCVTLEQVEQVAKEISLLDSRTNLKGLAESAMRSLADFDMELSRIYAHQSEKIREKIKYTFRELHGEERRSLLYDIIIGYDLWFRSAKQEEEEEMVDDRG